MRVLSRSLQLNHPALVALLALVFVTLVLGAFGEGPGLIWFALLGGSVILGTLALFAILFILVFLAQTIYKRRHRTTC